MTEADWRELIRLDWRGDFRPLRAAPTLRDGWIIHTRDLTELRRVLDYIYPAELANWALSLQRALPVTPWRETAERQTGRFRIVRELDDAGIAWLVAKACEPGCLKRRLWSPVEESIDSAPEEIPLLCPEACNFLVGKAREKLKGPGED